MAKLWTYRSSSTEVSPTLYTDGNPITDYTIKGNTIQSGTPSPDNPIMPEGCGDLETVGAKAGQYKIPISSANTITPVYLGEVETTRKIKKYICTGDETVDKIDNNIYYLSGVLINDAPILGASAICTHYENNPITSGISTNLLNGQFTINQVGSGNYSITIHDDINGGNVSARYKQYLAQQYAAGTPVTVWYILSTEETGIVNEPLMKIGDYADSITATQSQVSIPTTAGESSITFLTDIQPSRFELPIEGWYFDNPKKWDGSKWV